MVDTDTIRQSEILELMVERRNSLDPNKKLPEEKRPLKIKDILEDNIKPSKEEYVLLNDLDRRGNSSHSTAIGNVYSNFTTSSGVVVSLNRCLCR